MKILKDSEGRKEEIERFSWVERFSLIERFFLKRKGENFFSLEKSIDLEQKKNYFALWRNERFEGISCKFELENEDRRRWHDIFINNINKIESERHHRWC